MVIKVLGAGCTKCNQLYKLVDEVVKSEGYGASIEKIDDIADVISYDVASTPALVINEKVALKGKLPKRDELIKIIEQHK